jgi:hypothetical protein
MKKRVLALTVLAFCSDSFAQNPGLKKVNLQQEVDAAAAQETTNQAAPNSPFATTTCQYNFTTGSSNPVRSPAERPLRGRLWRL